MKKAILKVCSFAACMLAIPLASSASTETVLYSFPNHSAPYGRLLENNAGTFYGTTYDGGGSGTVYQLKESRGVWHARTIEDFTGSNGRNPFSGLVQDPQSGILYGNTLNGGVYGAGTLFSVSHAKSGWIEEVLHSFDQTDGKSPQGELTRDHASGILYGTTSLGGEGCGTAFSFDPATDIFKTLYEFQGGANDGCNPEVQLRTGPKAGSFLGATASGGASGNGTVFLLSEQGGVWSDTLIHSFNGSDGRVPSDTTVLNDDNAIYGVTAGGGVHSSGVVFQLKQKKNRQWSYDLLYAFTGGADGNQPTGLLLDSNTGILYGTTMAGGGARLGVLFSLQRNVSNGVWQERVLHSFLGGADGTNPQSRPNLDQKTEILYGTTVAGGEHGGGTVYAITP